MWVCGYCSRRNSVLDDFCPRCIPTKRVMLYGGDVVERYLTTQDEFETFLQVSGFLFDRAALPETPAYTVSHIHLGEELVAELVRAERIA